jgi:O-antigen ligase
MFRQIARALLYAVPLVLVVVMPSTFFPFIGIKYFLFRTLVTLATMALFVGWAFEENPRSLKERFTPVFQSPIGIAFVFLTAILLLATAFAYDPLAALWSNFERAEGSFQFVHYLLFFVLAGGLFTERKHVRLFMGFSIAAAVGVGLYGLFAAIDPTSFIGLYSGYADKPFLERLTIDRFQGSLGNAAYVTSFFTFIMGYIVWLWSESSHRVRAAILSIFGLGFSLIFFLLSGTRGAFLGAVAGAGIAALYVAWRQVRYRRVVLAVLAALAVVFSGLLVMRNHPVVTALPGSRILQIDFGQLTAQSRLWTWHAAWKGFTERPLLGWGPENFTVVFDKHFDARHFVPGQNSETWFDRAHNIVLEYLVAAGILGLIAWMSFVAALFMQLVRSIRSRVFNTTQEAVLLALLVAYVVQSLLLFDVLPIFINVAFLAAVMVSASRWETHPTHQHHD